jgi:uncharacterized protein (TIGR02231 family)
MAYRHIAIIVMALALPAAAFAQQPQRLTIGQATVFLSGAELQSSASLNLAKGDNEILFSNVAGDVNAQSLVVSATNDVVVTSATFRNNYLDSQVASPAAGRIKDSIEMLTGTREEIQTRLEVVRSELTILGVNRKDTARSVEEMTKFLDLTNARMASYLTQRKKEEKLLEKVNQHITRLNKQLKEEQSKCYQPGGQLVVKFYAKEATSTNVTINYVVPHAGWSPTYDIMADNTSSPVQLYYKANIYQNSGVKWNNVHLVLSTGNPHEGIQAPVLDPLYLTYFGPPVSKYDMEELRKPQILKEKSNVVGARSSGNTYIVDGIVAENNTTINDYVAVDNAGINTSFDIDLPYTIPTDGQEHLVAIKKYDLPATYSYYTVPKLDKDAFLRAQITNWEGLNLLPGKTNIFYEGAYVGEGAIDVRNTQDTMSLSLGRDKKIIVKRDRDTKLHTIKTIGSNQRETFAYTITIRNTRKENVSLTVQDQLPVSNEGDIVVEDKDIPGAEYDETTGSLKWNITLAANETRKIAFGYTVKYPKGKTVNNLR